MDVSSGLIHLLFKESMIQSFRFDISEMNSFNLPAETMEEDMVSTFLTKDWTLEIPVHFSPILVTLLDIPIFIFQIENGKIQRPCH
jgi:hypothetical protein